MGYRGDVSAKISRKERRQRERKKELEGESIENEQWIITEEDHLNIYTHHPYDLAAIHMTWLPSI